MSCYDWMPGNSFAHCCFKVLPRAFYLLVTENLLIYGLTVHWFAPFIGDYQQRNETKHKVASASSSLRFELKRMLTFLLWERESEWVSSFTFFGFVPLSCLLPILVAARSSMGLLPFACWDCGFEFHRGVDVCLLWVLCGVRYRSLRQADPLSRWVLPRARVTLCYQVQQ
jgi:hypothetical protein